MDTCCIVFHYVSMRAQKTMRALSMRIPTNVWGVLKSIKTGYTLVGVYMDNAHMVLCATRRHIVKYKASMYHAVII